MGDIIRLPRVASGARRPYNKRMVRLLVTVAALALATASAQVPVPFPKPGQAPPTQKPPVPTEKPAQPPVQQPAQPKATTGDPTEATLGVVIYPGALFLKSFDAGMGQRYYLFGTNAAFAQIVAYYRTVLKQRGELVFEQPPVHQFDLGRFREETMAFPPSVTVKDYAFGGAQGYLHPKSGAPAERFKTIIQIVPAPPAASR